MVRSYTVQPAGPHPTLWTKAHNEKHCTACLTQGETDDDCAWFCGVSEYC